MPLQTHSFYHIKLFIHLFTHYALSVLTCLAFCKAYSLLSGKSFLLYSVIRGLVKKTGKMEKWHDMQQSSCDEQMSKLQCHQLWFFGRRQE